MLSAQAYSPYGEPMFTDMPTEFGFIGEQTDPTNDLVYLRARVMNPKLGIFGSLDPFEGELSAPLTMNGYGWVEGNTPNLTDATGWSTGTCQAPSKGLSPLTASGSLGLVSLPKKAPYYDFWKITGSFLGLQQGNGAESQFISNSPENPSDACGIDPIKVFCKALGGGGGGALRALALVAGGAWAIHGLQQIQEKAPILPIQSDLDQCIDECKDFVSGDGFFNECMDQCRFTGMSYYQCQSKCMATLSQYLKQCGNKCNEIFG